jgi:hypothetical protein
VGDQAASANEEAFVKDRGQFVPGRKRKRWGAALGAQATGVKIDYCSRCPGGNIEAAQGSDENGYPSNR